MIELTHPSPYVVAAIQGELRQLGQDPHENINKPQSGFFACLIRLASIGKAAGIPPGHFVPHIWARAQTPHRRFRDVERQWRNAWQMAVPRDFPTGVTASPLLPPPPARGGAYDLG
jgi:hypothetical protein